jgi:peptide/nickel transport system ATP-binding protein/oligopeptide transport system ATP-binding protein
MKAQENTMDEKIIQVRNLKTYFYSYEGVMPAVDDLSFEISKGETLAVVGESGCGKSVTSMSLLKLIKPPGKIVSGEILYKNENLLDKTHEEMRSIRGKEISMIFQEPSASLNPVIKIGRQMTESILTHIAMSRKEAYERSVALLKKVGIPSPERIMESYAYELSGGMCQRVMIAMAISCNPKILICDEPTTALDVTIQAQILRLLKELKKETGASIMLITHDMGIVAQMAEKVMVMYSGQAVEYTDVREIFKNPLHPYTVGLLNSIPKLTENQDRLYNIEGMVPGPKDLSKGCRFAPRCEFAKERCYEIMPELIDAGKGHQVRCFKYGK